ncbi:MAG: hypothetical protein R2991_04345 [Thermoanaerobaculia bacterium]
MPPLVFLQLPHCGDLRLRELLERWIPEERRLAVYDGQLRLGGPDPEFVARARERVGELDLVYGYLSFGVHRFLDVEPRYAMFLRDPVERIVSLHAAVADGVGVGEWVASGTTELTNNHACRMLAGFAPEPGRTRTDRELFDAAVATVDQHVELLGVLERFEPDAHRLAALLGVPGTLDMPGAERSPGTGALSPEAAAILREHNRLDVELYRRALEAG